MGSRSALAGMEVPIIGSDSLKWIEIPAPAADISTTTRVIPLTHDIAYSVAIGDPSSRIHLIRRIHNDLPHHLELFELSISKDFPKVGLRITFPDALSPHVPICINKIDMGSMSHPYLVYALTVSGVAYLFRLGPISTYASRSVFREDEVVMLNMNPSVPVTSAAGTSSGCLVVGRDDGFLACFQLGKLDPTAPASSGKGSSQALRSLPQEAGSPNLGFTSNMSASSWRLHYYQWAMQIFEQYNISEGACQFALAALEQVEEASVKDELHGRDSVHESVSTITGRLWANVFKFTLDRNLYFDAYCAVISNPDEESKYICLRRLIIVLYERGAIKILCDGQLPFVGLTEKVEYELARKEDCSDILAKPNLYKLLYAFEMHQHNWRRAASYMYLYSARLRTETALKDYQHMSLALKDILNGLSVAINALHLVHPANAWIDPLLCTASNSAYPQTGKSYIDIEKIEDEFVLTSAEYLLSLAHIKPASSGTQKAPLEVVDLLMQTNSYDMAFTILLRFLKGSELKRGMERVFSAMSLRCCSHRVDSSWVGNDHRARGLPLTLSMDDVAVHEDVGSTNEQFKGISQWGTLELYLDKYKVFHAGLPLIVAETLLRSDPQIELPLWLVKMFKDGRKDKTWGMTGQESNPALLFQLYVDYGRYREATNLLLEYIGLFASMRPADMVTRKRRLRVWFPYTGIQRLWCQLEELISSGHMVDECNKLKNLLRGALLSHLELVKADSEDAVSALS